ncbi:MAG: 6-carboxytetrahydropterin synthase [Bacteroidota bacterium]|jgi:6-pyruvoyltetrahydropterin/6-carboxytetrahydropterin synthase
MVYLTRREYFCASHRLFNPKFSDEKNLEIYGKCAYPNGHGHNYELVVTVVGEPDRDTGMIMDLKKLSELVNREIIDKVDHRYLNIDVDFLKDVIPTAENLSVAFWDILSPRIAPGRLWSVRIYENANNYAEYRGGPSEKE